MQTTKGLVEIEKVQLIVEYMDDINESAIGEIATLKYRLPLINAYVLEVPANYVKELRGLKNIKAVYETSNITAQMNLARKAVKADSPALKKYTGRGITIAVLDTGLSPNNDFIYPRNRLIYFKDFVNGKSEFYDDNGHGTHVWSMKEQQGYYTLRYGRSQGFGRTCLWFLKYGKISHIKRKEIG